MFREELLLFEGLYLPATGSNTLLEQKTVIEPNDAPGDLPRKELLLLGTLKNFCRGYDISQEFAANFSYQLTEVAANTLFAIHQAHQYVSSDQTGTVIAQAILLTLRRAC